VAIREVWSKDKQCTVYRADYSVIINGKRKRIRKDFLTKASAKKAVRDDMVAAEKGEYKSQAHITLKQWVEKVMVYVKAKRHGSTPNQYGHALAEFISIIGEGRKLESLDRSDLRRFIDHLINQGLGEATIKSYYAKIRSALNFAPLLFDSLLMWQPPLASYELLTLTQTKFATKSTKKGRILSVEEIRKLLLAMADRPVERDAIICALNTGGRLREVLTLTWDRVHWNVVGATFGTVELRVTKIRGVPESFRTVVMTKELAEMLRRRQMESKGRAVFPATRNPNKFIRVFSTYLSEACKTAGIPYGRHLPNGFVFHHLRKTSVTYLRDMGINPEVVSAITGHSIAVMMEDYSKPGLASQQEALNKLAEKYNLGQLMDRAENGKEEENAASSTGAENAAIA
jgi:integrase